MQVKELSKLSKTSLKHANKMLIHIKVPKWQANKIWIINKTTCEIQFRNSEKKA